MNTLGEDKQHKWMIFIDLAILQFKKIIVNNFFNYNYKFLLFYKIILIH